MVLRFFLCFIFVLDFINGSIGLVVDQPDQRNECQRTTVAILGAGVAGITAAQALTNASISDFLIVEYNSDIGGRAKHTTFGARPDGTPYVVELGANWIQGLGKEDTTENPIWTLAKKYDLENVYSNYSSILTYNETGFFDYSELVDNFDRISQIASSTAGNMLVNNIQDQSLRTGLAVAGWLPERSNMAAQAVEWWGVDFDAAYSPDECSFIFGEAGDNFTFGLFGEDNNFVIDQRGFNTIVKEEASTFLQPNDRRLLLNTIVTNVSYTSTGVTITHQDGSCISADYAICTFSLGVLQNDVVAFQPQLPSWKNTAIHAFQMATYTKIFLQFNETFWPNDTQFFLYADPTRRGYYPLFQSLSTEGFMPDSNIIFVTVVGPESYRVEQQTEEETAAQIVAVLRRMFPDVNVPDPTAIMYPRWTSEPWSRGSYSNWPPSTTLEMHQNLRANVERLWFAGEAMSAAWFGYLHGAWFSGREVGERIAGLLGKGCASAAVAGACGDDIHYDELPGTTNFSEYSMFNGWPGNSLDD